MATAQQVYLDMMKSRIAPGLRALGFKGSGQNYELQSPDHWAVLAFQKSRGSDANRLRFTINVLVVSRDAWEAERTKASHLPQRPSATTYWGEPGWQHRISELVPGTSELWWEVDAAADTAALAGAVLWAVKDYALPAMRRQMRA